MSGQDSCGKTASLGGQVKTKFRVDVSYQASEAGPSDSPAAVSEAGSSGVGTEEVQGEVDAILTALYVGAGRPAAVGVPSLLRVALSNPTGAWVFEESGLELLLLWYPALTPKFQAALLRFLCLTVGRSDPAPALAALTPLVRGNIRNLTALGEAAHGQRANPELLIYSVELGTLISQDPNVFVQEIKGEVLNLLSPGMPRGGGYDFATRALEGLTPHLVRYRDLYASEAVPLLIAGIREGAWRTKVRGELMAHLATRSTAEAVVDCVGGLPFLLSRDNAEASVAVVSALASRLVQLPDAPDLLGGLAELLCTQLQSLVGCASSLSGLEAGVAVMHRALGRGSGPLALPKAASEQVSSLLIRLGNHGHHVALLRHSPETLLSYLSLVGRYAANDPSVAAHLEQLLAAGGWEVVAQSDGLPLLGARFPQGPYSSLLHRYWCSSGAPHPPIRRRLFEALLALGEDLLLNAFEEPKPREGPPPARPSSMLLRMRLPALHHDYELSPDSYPAPNPAQFEYLWGKYPLRYTGPVWRAEGYKRPSNLPTSDVVVKTVAAAPPSRNGSSLKWCGYTFETRHQLLILMTYRSHAPGEGAELTVRSGSAIPPGLLMGLKGFFGTFAIP